MPYTTISSIPGVATYVVQRSHNQQIIFKNDVDKEYYKQWLTEYSFEFDVAIHAWVIVDSHVHLLCTPNTKNGVALMTQELGHSHRKHFNEKHNEAGIIEETMFYTSRVFDETRLLELYRNIELNPVRIGMVTNPGHYTWSSYQNNGLGEYSNLTTPHYRYLQLGSTRHERLVNYSTLVHQKLDRKSLLSVRLH